MTDKILESAKLTGRELRRITKEELTDAGVFGQTSKARIIADAASEKVSKYYPPLIEKARIEERLYHLVAVEPSNREVHNGDSSRVSVSGQPIR